ncbi:putative tyrosinase central domain protein [Phaeoacremonium minimum UCRPA7]|uniref:Putative tyrosinase central domain protein n=1 Tax=Phaeoacremonium minimum (strain UCR-PA7) TaxID=1286976 RepID=R8BPJ4_PHAM7|nr:putative tyrosinase central domain protein [Phaeoacremonium minimum UCRPA7]EOO01262.1 putative tyrosinase central domain protein [Phaeoacremonium minimum UCRPA7]
MKASTLLTALLVPFAAAAPSPRTTKCTTSNAVQRKEWGSMSNSEKLSYIDGVKCLMKQPSKFKKGLVPASTSWFSDFAGVHVNLTTSIHISGIFLSWHRHFLYLMEEALHDKCNYPKTLGLPYWDWTKYPTLETSPLFNGGPYSLGGNGLYEDTGPYIVGVGQELPHGSGGGCVTTGPFANTTVNFGPFNFNLVFTGLPATWNIANPRCMNRDLNNYGIKTYDNQTLINEMLAATTIKDVQILMNSKNVGTTDRGLHGGGHYGVGGVMFDFFASPQDPAFFLHHGQIDRIWAQWQAANPKVRRYQYNGTSTIFNTNATPEVSNCTIMDFGVLGSPQNLRDVADPMSGLYCYRYV